MKKYFLPIGIALSLSLFAGCAQAPANNPAASAAPAASQATQLNKIVVGASPTPHAEILAVAKEDLAAKGYELVIKEFVDYVQPNLTLQNKELDANYFQHKPYLDDFNVENKTTLESIAAIHYEPFGIYPGKTKSLSDLADGAQIAVPNDSTNEARALLLLEAQGLIKLKENAGLKATVTDIAENPKNIKIREIEAAQLARSLPDVDIAVINGNYALEAKLNVKTDALAIEDASSLAAETYANIIAIRQGDENREDLKALVDALKSEKVKKFIEEKYSGSVVPMY